MSNWAKAGRLLINIWLVFMAVGIILTLIAAIFEPILVLGVIIYAAIWYPIYKFMQEVK